MDGTRSVVLSEVRLRKTRMSHQNGGRRRLMESDGREGGGGGRDWEVLMGRHAGSGAVRCRMGSVGSNVEKAMQGARWTLDPLEVALHKRSRCLPTVSSI